MRTYMTTTGRVLDLHGLDGRETAFFERALDAFRRGTPWPEFCELTQSPNNPALEQGRATVRSIENPLYVALIDMEGRLGVAQGFLRSQGAFLDVDPMVDYGVSVQDAAAERHVSRQTLYNAIESGQLIATRERPLRISRNSLTRWRPQRARAS